jgi:hypothetical protein
MGDRVVYRNLEPMDEQISGLRESWREVGLDHYYVPRKTTPEYAAALNLFVKSAQRTRGQLPVERALFIGDTLMNDGTAARNLSAYQPVMGFIGADRLDEPISVEIKDDLMIANRWSALGDYVDWVRRSGFACDDRTVLLIDLDKTSLGARGRNDKVIDTARVQAVQRTMRSALGEQFDEGAFRAVYDRLNQPAYHYFTGDNQDYLAYVSLMVTGGVWAANDLWDALESGQLRDVEAYVAACDERRMVMSDDLLRAQDEVLRGLETEDPTPFKAFRRGEFFETVERMDVLGDEADENAVLGSEIVITAEVASVAAHLAEQGVLIMGISDKPDEASVPMPGAAAKGYRPIHRTTMKVLGGEIT